MLNKQVEKRIRLEQADNAMGKYVLQMKAHGSSDYWKELMGEAASLQCATVDEKLQNEDMMYKSFPPKSFMSTVPTGVLDRRKRSTSATP